MASDEHDDRPCIVAFGARTPVGRSGPATAAAVAAGVVRFVRHPHYADPNDRPLVVAYAGWLDPARGAMAHLAALAVPAAREALATLAPGPIKTWLALASARPGRPPRLETTLGDRLRDRLAVDGHVVELAGVFPGDHSAGLLALAHACAELQTGRAQRVMVGGVDSLLEFATLDWLIGDGRVRVPGNPRGFIPGEGAGFVVLTTARHARHHGLPVLGRVAAVTLEREAMHARDAVNTGAGLSAAMHASLAALPAGARVSTRYCDLNGEPHRASEYGFATVRTADRLERPDVFVAPAVCWGDVGAATAPLLLGLAVAAAVQGRADGPHSLVTTSAEDGLRGAALIDAAVQAGPEFL